MFPTLFCTLIRLLAEVSKYSYICDELKGLYNNLSVLSLSICENKTSEIIKQATSFQ